MLCVSGDSKTAARPLVRVRAGSPARARMYGIARGWAAASSGGDYCAAPAPRRRTQSRLGFSGTLRRATRRSRRRAAAPPRSPLGLVCARAGRGRSIYGRCALPPAGPESRWASSGPASRRPSESPNTLT